MSFLFFIPVLLFYLVISLPVLTAVWVVTALRLTLERLGKTNNV